MLICTMYAVHKLFHIPTAKGIQQNHLHIVIVVSVKTRSSVTLTLEIIKIFYKKSKDVGMAQKVQKLS